MLRAGEVGPSVKPALSGLRPVPPSSCEPVTGSRQALSGSGPPVRGTKAVLNLLPLPVLDGGQILMGSLEEAFPRLVRLRPAVTLVGLLFLAGVMIYANVHDVVRYWG